MVVFSFIIFPSMFLYHLVLLSVRFFSLLQLAYTAEEFGAKEITLVAPYLAYGAKDRRILEGEVVNKRVIQIMDGFISQSLNATNGILAKLSPTGVTAISNAINEGAGFVDFSGHGATNVWTT